MNEKLKSLFEGVEFTKETEDRISVVFESLVNEAITSKEEEIEQKYKTIAEDYAEYVKEEYKSLTEAYINEEIIPAVTKYVDYAVSEFVKDKSSIVENIAKANLADAFLKGIVSVAEQFNVEVPTVEQEKEIGAIRESLESVTKRFDSLLDENKALQDQINNSTMDKIFEEVTKSLSESQKESLKKNSNTVSFICEDQYRTAVTDLKEAYFPVNSDEGDVSVIEEIKPKLVMESTQEKYITTLLGKI